jgi:hypothetical protein
LNSTVKERDLGVTITPDLKWDQHIKIITGKAYGLLNEIRRTFETLDEEMFLILYKSLVRPHLEYCIQAWSPHLVGDKARLEKVQRRATKLVPSLKHLPYEERLQRLNLF